MLTLCQHYAILEWMSHYQQTWERCARQRTNKVICVWNTRQNNLPLLLHFYMRQSHMENYKCFHMYYQWTNKAKATNRITNNWPSCVFLTSSSTCAHCSIRASLGAARKNVHLKVPRLRICWRCLYSRPISKLMHSRRSMILRGVFDDSAAFLDL